ncbi:hypothetical protein [Cupriavidus sp. CuC1]|uniref:hypothetical protein n=1 Tax=Cupriavidus sp. CuC1 TaxID=3373131 RepID=UPI0037D7AC57
MTRAIWEVNALVQLNAVDQFVVTVLLGTNTLTYGEKTLAGFVWQSVLASGIRAKSAHKLR